MQLVYDPLLLVFLSLSAEYSIAMCGAYARDGYGAFRQPKFECGFCKMQFFRVCGVRQNLDVFSLQSRWPDFWLFTNINGCRVGWGCAWTFPVCLWFEWLLSGVVGFYNHKSSCCRSLWLRNCVWLRSVGCRPDPCTWRNTWPPDNWCSWPSIGCSFSTHR